MDLRDNILHFYSDLSAPIETKKDKDRWQSSADGAGSIEIDDSSSDSRGRSCKVTLSRGGGRERLTPGTVEI